MNKIIILPILGILSYGAQAEDVSIKEKLLFMEQQAIVSVQCYKELQTEEYTFDGICSILPIFDQMYFSYKMTKLEIIGLTPSQLKTHAQNLLTINKTLSKIDNIINETATHNIGI